LPFPTPPQTAEATLNGSVASFIATALIWRKATKYFARSPSKAPLPRAFRYHPTVNSTQPAAFDCNLDAMAGLAAARGCVKTQLVVLKNEKMVQITFAENKNAQERKCEHRFFVTSCSQRVSLPARRVRSTND
jgi:hypothetical protein